MAKYPDLDGKTALVTGGANGIGAAIVRALCAQGVQAHFCDIDADAGKRLVAELGSRAKFHRADLTREAEIKKWIADVGRRRCSIDVLFNNAAADPRIALEDTATKQWDDLFARNLRAGFLTSREVAPFMSAGGSIVNFASITFHTAPERMTAYVATKGGVISFTRALARELGPRRIRVNTISPGWVMTERQLRDFVTPATKRMIRRVQCVPDLIQPSEIADVALFLASEASAAITGQELLADRGWAHS